MGASIWLVVFGKSFNPMLLFEPFSRPRSPEARPEALSRFRRWNGVVRRSLVHLCAIKAVLRIMALRRHHFDFPVRPILRPFDPIIPNPVVRTTGEVPVPDGWIERDSFAVKNQFPVGRCQRRDNFASTPTAAAMDRSSILHRNVEHGVLKCLGNAFHEIMRQVIH